jgi:hypothetical protein
MYPIRTALSAGRKSMNESVAAAENPRLKGLRSGEAFASGLPFPTLRCGREVRPNAGLSNASVLEPITDASGFSTLSHENKDAPKPCKRIAGSLFAEIPNFLCSSESLADASDSAENVKVPNETVRSCFKIRTMRMHMSYVIVTQERFHPTS